MTDDGLPIKAGDAGRIIAPSLKIAHYFDYVHFPFIWTQVVCNGFT